MQYDKIITLYVTLQNVIHQIDDITDTTYFKHEFKQRTLNYLNYIERFIQPLDKGMDLEEANQYVDLVNQLDDFTKELITKVEFERE